MAILWQVLCALWGDIIPISSAFCCAANKFSHGRHKCVSSIRQERKQWGCSSSTTGGASAIDLPSVIDNMKTNRELQLRAQPPRSTLRYLYDKIAFGSVEKIMNVAFSRQLETNDLFPDETPPVTDKTTIVLDEVAASRDPSPREMDRNCSVWSSPVVRAIAKK